MADGSMADGKPGALGTSENALETTRAESELSANRRSRARYALEDATVFAERGALALGSARASSAISRNVRTASATSSRYGRRSG
jgi:hypothetical protein